MAKPNPRAPLGQGGRFAALSAKLANRPGVTNPDALSAYIGRKEYGSGKFAAMAAKGKKKAKGKSKGKGDSPAVEAAERAAGKAT